MPDTCRSSISILVLMSVCVCAQLAMSAPDKAYSSVKTGNSALIRTIDTSESTFVQDDNSLLLNAAGNSVGKVDMQPWIAYSQRQLKRAWSQPRDPKTLSTVVTFRVDAHGRASKIAVEKPSGSKSFDKSTVEAVRSLNLLHKPPIETVRLRARFVHTVFRVLHAKDREFFLTRGRALIATQQYREAVADLTKSIAAKQWPADSYLARAECFDRLGDSQKAIADYSECIRRDPVAVEPHWHRGIAYMRSEEHLLALKDFVDAMQLIQSKSNDLPGFGADEFSGGAAPENSNRLSGDIYSPTNIYDWLVKALSKLEESGKAQSPGPRTNPQNAVMAKAYCFRGIHETALGHYSRGIDDLTRTLTMAPNMAQAYEWRAVAHEKMGRHSLAAKDRRALSNLTAVRSK